MNPNFNNIKKNVDQARENRIAKRKTGGWRSAGNILLLQLDFKNRWLLYLAALISAAFTGASVFIIFSGDMTDVYRIVFAGVFALVTVCVCEPALLWWLNRVEYHQNNVQMAASWVGLVVSSALTARTVWSAGELLIWAFGEKIFSNYTSIDPSTQDWMVHFIPILVIVHVGLGLLYFTQSEESKAKRMVENVTRNANTRVLTAKADADADTAEAMADAMTAMISDLAPKVGIENARKAVVKYMISHGYDFDNDGEIDPNEKAAFNRDQQRKPQAVNLRPVNQYNFTGDKANDLETLRHPPFSDNGHGKVDTQDPT